MNGIWGFQDCGPIEFGDYTKITGVNVLAMFWKVSSNHERWLRTIQFQLTRVPLKNKYPIEIGQKVIVKKIKIYGV